MALKFNSKTEQIEVVETFEVNATNKFDLTYRFQLRDGQLEGQISAEAIKQGEGRHIMSKSTHDGQSFHGNSNDLATDNLTGLDGKMKADLIAIFNDPAAVSQPA